MYSPAEENYLKGLLLLSEKHDSVSINNLSKHLNIKMPTVNSMTKRLVEKGLVSHKNYKPVYLTEKGRIQACFVMRKHRLTEMFLVEKMSFGWEEVHEIAEQIEHIQSPSFFEKMDEILNYPEFDPHGAPIPNKEGSIKQTSYTTLSDCKVSDIVVLKAVSKDTSELLKYLSDRSIKLGIHIKICAIDNFDGLMTVNYGNRENEVLSSAVTEKLLVEILN